jgi:hypothetical protein
MSVGSTAIVLPSPSAHEWDCQLHAFVAVRIPRCSSRRTQSVAAPASNGGPRQESLPRMPGTSDLP